VEFDASVPNVARMYDYWLGGKDNFAADRSAADEVATAAPDTPIIARQNRDFLGRVVRYLADECGIRQFLDIGTGLPTRDNVHEVAHACDPDCRVVYVDYDRNVVAHARALLANDPSRIGVVEADIRDPDVILAAPQTRRLIDFSQPVAVLMIAVLHFLPDGDGPQGVAEHYAQALPRGGYMAISHIEDRARLQQGAEIYTAQASASVHLRTKKEITDLFCGLEILEPGVVPVNRWQATVSDEDGDAWFLGGLARKE
jgi:hypothetical protein